MHVLDIGLVFVYILLSIAILLAVSLPLIFNFKRIQSNKSLIFTVSILGIIFLISCFFSHNDLYAKFPSVTETSSRIIEAGIITLYITGIIAILVLITSPFFKNIKKH